MRAVVQRVKKAHVEVEEKIIGSIDEGLCVLLGVKHSDTEKDADYIIDKITNMRIFPDSENKMNLSLIDTRGSLLIISQFTLYGDIRKGRRPSFTAAAKGENATSLYNYIIENCRRIEEIPAVETGEFGAMMDVHIENNGPVTILLDSERIF